MSGEIKVQSVPVDKSIAELRSSIQTLETTFSKEVEGSNSLDMVTAFNQIKKEYDELLSQFKTLFMNNIQATEDSIAKIQETEQIIANNMNLK